MEIDKNLKNVVDDLEHTAELGHTRMQIEQQKRDRRHEDAHNHDKTNVKNR